MERKYININGEYGLGAGGITGWGRVQEVLGEMDRLGIWQTVLEFVGATNSLYRAKKLLQHLSQLDCPRERIIPCFSVEPGLLFQYEAMNELVELMKLNRPCCVSLRPKSCNYSLKAIEQVLQIVAPYSQVIMININQIKDRNKGADDLAYLADRFPELRFVIRQGHQSAWPFIYNVMWRTKNVYIDVSRMHSMHAIELACERFGEDRLLFGQSAKGSGGASMGAIEYADVSDETKEKIRCRNFINLFQDPKDREVLTANLRYVEDKVANSFWRPFIEGKGVTKTELYDVHTHLGYTASYGYIRDLTFERQIANFEREMERFNIKKIVSAVTGINDPIDCHLEKEAAVKGKEDRFLGYVRYNPNYEEVYTDEFMAERFATGYYVGLKSLPVYMETDIRDKKYERMFQYANDHGLAILLHTNADPKGSPLSCAEVAVKYPNAKVILGHSGLGDEGRAQCVKIANDPKYQNVYFEICGTFLSTIPWAESLKQIDYKRVLYGTDAPIHSVVWELSRMLSEDIPDEQLAAILGGNAKRLFGF